MTETDLKKRRTVYGVIALIVVGLLAGWLGYNAGAWLGRN